MLVLTRKHQEKIRIGDNITITVLKTKGKAVRLGIEAPADVPVIRGELVLRRPSRRVAGEASDNGSEAQRARRDGEVSHVDRGSQRSLADEERIDWCRDDSAAGSDVPRA